MILAVKGGTPPRGASLCFGEKVIYRLGASKAPPLPPSPIIKHSLTSPLAGLCLRAIYLLFPVLAESSLGGYEAGKLIAKNNISCQFVPFKPAFWVNLDK